MQPPTLFKAERRDAFWFWCSPSRRIALLQQDPYCILITIRHSDEFLRICFALARPALFTTFWVPDPAVPPAGVDPLAVPALSSSAIAAPQAAVAPLERWYVLIVMGLVYAINIAARYVVTTVFEPIRLELHLTDTGAAFLTGVPLA